MERETDFKRQLYCESVGNAMVARYHKALEDIRIQQYSGLKPGKPPPGDAGDGIRPHLLADKYRAGGIEALRALPIPAATQADERTVTDAGSSSSPSARAMVRDLIRHCGVTLSLASVGRLLSLIAAVLLRSIETGSSTSPSGPVDRWHFGLRSICGSGSCCTTNLTAQAVFSEVAHERRDGRGFRKWKPGSNPARHFDMERETADFKRQLVLRADPAIVWIDWGNDWSRSRMALEIEGPGGITRLIPGLSSFTG